MTSRFALPYAYVPTIDGTPMSGAKLYFYLSGTDTPKNTYSNPELTIANTNPVIANAGGRFGNIFLDGVNYKVILRDADDVLIWTADPLGTEDTYESAIAYATGDGVETAFEIPTEWVGVISPLAMMVFWDGAQQDPNTYEIVGSDIVFSTAPPYNCAITLRNQTVGPRGEPGTGDVDGPASSTDGVMALFDGTTGKLLKTGGLPFTNPMTSVGDVIVGGVAGDPSRLAIGTSTQFLGSSGVTPVWKSIALADLPSQADLTVLGRNGSSGTPLAVSTPMLSVITAANAAAARTVLGAGTGNGDVVGPASATDSVMALFDGTTGKLLKAGAAPFTNPMTTMGDMIIGGASGAPFRLALGAPRTMPISDGSTPVMRALQLADLPSQADLTVLGRNGSSGTPLAVSTPMLSVITAADAAAARTVLSAAGSGAVTASGLTMATARLLGRSTASTGAIEEITVGSGLSLSAGTLTASGGTNPGTVLLATATASSSATIDITGLDSTYDAYLIEFDGVQPASSSTFRVRVESGGTWQSANYAFCSVNAVSSASTISGSSATSGSDINIGSAATNSNTSFQLAGQLWIYQPSATTFYKPVIFEAMFRTGTPDISMAKGAGQWEGGTGAVTGVRLWFGSGINVAVGNFRLYGLRKTV